MKFEDLAEEQSKLVVDAYSYALTNKLDIRNQDDVLKMLAVLDPENTRNMKLENFMLALDMFDDMTKAELTKKRNPQ